VAERAGGSRIKIHHDQYPQKRIGIAAANRAGQVGGEAPSMDELVEDVKAIRAARKTAKQTQ